MLNPAEIMLIVQGIQAAISAAKEVGPIIEAAKNWITTLFEKGLISKATQDLVHAHVDAWAASVASGTTPPEFTVEADPV
jgi:hypothetical protein